jgi:hypothetical protein
MLLREKWLRILTGFNKREVSIAILFVMRPVAYIIGESIVNDGNAWAKLFS